jgi:hypothetical protein
MEYEYDGSRDKLDEQFPLSNFQYLVITEINL